MYALYQELERCAKEWAKGFRGWALVLVALLLSFGLLNACAAHVLGCCSSDLAGAACKPLVGLCLCGLAAKWNKDG